MASALLSARPIGIARLVFLLVALLAGDAQAKSLYRCPGDPTLVTDEITATEAQKKGCHLVDPRWNEVSRNAHFSVYADTQSMRRNSPKVNIWLKWVWSKPAETAGPTKKIYRSEKRLATCNCAERTVALLQITRYADDDASGEIVETQAIPERRANFQAVLPESVDESIFEFACVKAFRRR